MPIHVEWDPVEPTIVQWTLSGKWTWQEFWQAFAQTNAMYDGRVPTLDVIVDAQTTLDLPPGALGEFRKVDASAGAHVRGLTVLVGGGAFGAAMLQTFKRIYRVEDCHGVKTLHEARALILKARAADRV